MGRPPSHGHLCRWYWGESPSQLLGTEDPLPNPPFPHPYPYGAMLSWGFVLCWHLPTQRRDRAPFPTVLYATSMMYKTACYAGKTSSRCSGCHGSLAHNKAHVSAQSQLAFATLRGVPLSLLLPGAICDMFAVCIDHSHAGHAASYGGTCPGPQD